MKRYVKVLASFSEEGDLTPVQITWKDGRKYDIDRVLKKERQASRRAGGAGIMYTCRIRGQEVHLFYEVDKWFVDEVRGH